MASLERHDSWQFTRETRLMAMSQSLSTSRTYRDVYRTDMGHVTCDMSHVSGIDISHRYLTHGYLCQEHTKMYIARTCDMSEVCGIDISHRYLTHGYMCQEHTKMCIARTCDMSEVCWIDMSHRYFTHGYLCK